MLGQPASSQTVCSPSRRTSDLSSVYSGPVFSRVLIHSGLRSIGTWLLRTSRRRSLRPPGPIGDPGSVVGAAVSVMTCTVPPADDRPGPSAGLVPGRCRPLASGVLLGLLAAVGQRGAGGAGGGGGGGWGGRPRGGAAPGPRGPVGLSVGFVASDRGSTPPGPSGTGRSGPAAVVLRVGSAGRTLPGSGTSPRFSSSGPPTGWLTWVPRSSSSGVASPGDVWALETVLPESLGTGSSR